MGNSGNSTGTHLHYEVREGGKAVNPMRYIKAAKDVF
jgi:murein DD-endopeptidase MepM/ murein hydrolase activator NlpD